MASRNAERKESITRGTGNVFADLGFPDAAERQAKLRLAYALNQVLEARKLSQADAAKVLGVTQPKVSALRHYKLAGFSVERLMNLLTALDQDIEIVIRQKPRSRKAGRISVVAAECCRGGSASGLSAWGSMQSARAIAAADWKKLNLNDPSDWEASDPPFWRRGFVTDSPTQSISYR